MGSFYDESVQFCWVVIGEKCLGLLLLKHRRRVAQSDAELAEHLLSFGSGFGWLQDKSEEY